MELLHINQTVARRKARSEVRTLKTITDWSALGDRLHAVQFYEADEVLVELISRFAGTALVTGDSAIVIATRKHREGVAQQLRKRGLDISVAEAQGRYIPLDAGRTVAKIMRDGKPDAVKCEEHLGRIIRAATKAADGGRQRVVAFGEMVALLWAQGKIEDAIRLEELWNGLSERYAFSLCCAYPMRGFTGSSHAAPFLKICAQHSHVFPVERRTARAVAAAL
jgi:hypothetical protein